MVSVVAKFRMNGISYRDYASSGPPQPAEQQTATLEFSPVTQGSEENKNFWKYTPSGKIELGTVNRDVVKALDLGREYYVYITDVKPEVMDAALLWYSKNFEQLPAFFILLDVAHGNRVLKPSERAKLLEEAGSPEFEAPLIDEQPSMTPDYFLAHLQDYLQRKPKFASSGLIEGIVVKNYDGQLFGKVVSFEFYRGIEESGSYLRRRVQEGNRLLPVAANRPNRFFRPT